MVTALVIWSWSFPPYIVVVDRDVVLIVAAPPDVLASAPIAIPFEFFRIEF